MNYSPDSLLTIDKQTLEVPETRMSDARAVQDYARQLNQDDQKRAWKRSRVNGLVDGNPPYSASKLRSAGRAEAANVNWGTGRLYLESGAGSFYDLSSEAPSIVTFRTSYGNPEQQESWSSTASEEANRIFAEEKLWDYTMQISQWDMVLHGRGPLLFESAYDVFPKAFHDGELKVPEWTRADTTFWDACCLEDMLWPTQMYDRIRNPEAAAKVGWDVEYTKMVIANAMDVRQNNGLLYDWEFYQQELKNNSLTYQTRNKVVRIVHVFWREFDGRITHSIVERDTTVTATGNKTSNEDNASVKFLYQKIGRYKCWDNVIHPMYYDRGNGGYHHSVTGLGVKMFAAMEYENRLLCNLADKAFAPKIVFNPTTTEASQKFQMIHMGDYAVMPGGFQVQQTGVAGLMEDGIAMRGVLSQTIQSTLSAYRQGIPSSKSGNPVTKYEKEIEASMQSALSKPQFNRYYKQLDALMAEIWRRLSNPSSSNEKAMLFQQRCKDRGVPIEALNRVAHVSATRVIGQGSAFMRKQSVDAVGAIVQALPEDGRNNWLNDKIAAEAGQSAINRYNPPQKNKGPTEQNERVTNQIAGIKVGIAPVIDSSQNPVIFAQTFLQAAAQSLASLQQGGNPMEVWAFVSLAGPAIAAHLKRMANDPTRKTAFEILQKQWEQLAAQMDKLKQIILRMQEQAKQQQQNTQTAMEDQQLKTAKTQSDIALKQQKTQAQLEQSQQKHQLKMAQAVQDLQIKDASAAADIHINRMKAEAATSDNGD